MAYEYSTFGGSTYTSTHTYDANGYLTSVAVADGAPITKYFLTDARGQMLQRKTRSTASPGASGLAYFQNPPSGGGFWGSDQTLFRFDGYQFGTAETGSYQQGIDERYWGRDPDAAQGFFTTPTSQPSASASYTVRAGETLSSIAAQTWGDASLWYVIAEANGLSGSGQVAPGQTLIIPNKAVRTHYNADTFRPYDGSELVGPTGASKPHVNRNKGDCGVLGVVIKMLVTIAVLSIMPTATSFLQGALFGGVANVAAQGVGMMTGIQNGFNWKELGMSAVSGGVAGELSGVKLFDKLGAFSEVGRQAAGGAISQGIGGR